MDKRKVNKECKRQKGKDMTDEEVLAKIKKLSAEDFRRLMQCIFCANDPKTCNGKDNKNGDCAEYTERGKE